jgi:ribosomal protein L12E/L44/L45/RPP1/RPP2
VLALHDGGAEITSDQINTLIAATQNSVEPYWPTLFASNLGSNVAEIIASRGGGGAVSTAAAAPVGKIPLLFLYSIAPCPHLSSAAGADAPAGAAAPEAKKVEEVVDALEGGMDMFGGGGGGGDY